MVVRGLLCILVVVPRDPAQRRYAGMPADRLWQFEDSAVPAQRSMCAGTH